jgi:hypothetical protein
VGKEKVGGDFDFIPAHWGGGNRPDCRINHQDSQQPAHRYLIKLDAGPAHFCPMPFDQTVALMGSQGYLLEW